VWEHGPLSRLGDGVEHSDYAWAPFADHQVESATAGLGNRPRIEKLDPRIAKLFASATGLGISVSGCWCLAEGQSEGARSSTDARLRKLASQFKSKKALKEDNPPEMFV
jgi:hypothetical protein